MNFGVIITHSSVPFFPGHQTGLEKELGEEGISLDYYKISGYPDYRELEEQQF